MTDKAKGSSGEPARTNHKTGTNWLMSGSPLPENGNPLHPSPVFASTFHLSGEPLPGVDFYGRNDNPTWRAVEAMLGDLEGGEALCFPSGMAAATAAIVPFVKTGDRVLIPSDGYHTVRWFVEHFLQPLGVQLETYPTAQLGDYSLADVSLLWIETPSNPGLDLCDIAAAVARAGSTGTMVVCDNTTMTPLGQRCLDLGADLVISADTKAVNGHADTLFGHVAGRKEDLMARVRQWRTFSGSIPGPMDAWLMTRGLQTLELRYEAMCRNAMAVATALQGHRKLEALRYPGLDNDPAARLASTQMLTGGFLVTMTFGDGEAADRFMSGLMDIHVATSFGGTQSTAETRHRWDSTVNPGLVRLSCGIEPAHRIIEDLMRALDDV